MRQNLCNMHKVVAPTSSSRRLRSRAAHLRPSRPLATAGDGEAAHLRVSRRDSYAVPLSQGLEVRDSKQWRQSALGD